MDEILGAIWAVQHRLTPWSRADFRIRSTGWIGISENIAAKDGNGNTVKALRTWHNKRELDLQLVTTQSIDKPAVK